MDVALIGRVQDIVQHEAPVFLGAARDLGLCRGVCARKAKFASDPRSPAAHLAVGRAGREALAVLPVAGAGCLGQELAALS